MKNAFNLPIRVRMIKEGLNLPGAYSSCILGTYKTMYKNKGQSIIEYTVLAMLIIVGTIVMGPYVIRSIGAHFKLWQETVDDSVNDRMKRIPISVTEQCRVSELMSSGCGAPIKQNFPLCPTGGLYMPATHCAANERYYFQTGTPDGCYYCEGCKADPTCCDVFSACISAPCCGKKTLPYPGFKRSNFIKDADGNDTVELPSVDRNGNANNNDYRDTSIPENESCYYGEMLLYNNCDNRRIRCQLNSDCNPNCIGNLPVNSLGTTTAHLCDPNPQNRLVADEKISWFNPCPAPPPPEPPEPAAEQNVEIRYRATSAMELYESDEFWTEGPLISTGFDVQCDKEPEEDWSLFEAVIAILGFGGCRTYTSLFWVGPFFTYYGIPLPNPSPNMAWDHGYWGCTRSDDPKHWDVVDGLIQAALNILFGFLGGSLTYAIIDPVDHPQDDWGWNGCWVDEVARKSNQCPRGFLKRCPSYCSPASGDAVYRTLNVKVTPGETTYLLAKVTADAKQPLFTFRPFTGTHFQIFEVFARVNGKNYCFKPTSNTYSRESSHSSPGPDTRDPAGDSCKYIAVSNKLQLAVTKELLKLEIPLEDGGDSTPIRYNCDECEGKCGPNPPACRAKCDVGYSQILVPDPDNPGNNIVTCLPCTGLKCNYTIDCRQGGLSNAHSSFIGASCEGADELIGCVDTGTGAGHGTTNIGFNGCYATSDNPFNRTAATNTSLYGCQLQCRKVPGAVTQCTD